MSYPKFSKTDESDLVFSRGDLYPSDSPPQFHQIKDVSQGQVARIAELAAPTTFLSRHFRLPAADYAALRTWLLDVAQGSLETFTFTDSDTTAYTVRWWPGEDNPLFKMPQVAFQLYEGEIVLKVEAS